MGEVFNSCFPFHPTSLVPIPHSPNTSLSLALSFPRCSPRLLDLAASDRRVSNTCLERIIQQHAQDVPNSSDSGESSSCLLEDMGELLVRSVLDLSKLADKSVRDQDVDIYVRLRVDEMHMQTDFSELGNLKYLENKHQALRHIVEILQNVAKDIRHLWLRRTNLRLQIR